MEAASEPFPSSASLPATMEATPTAPDKDSGVVSKLPAGDVDWDKYEILPDGNWYSFVKDGQRYYISYSDVGH